MFAREHTSSRLASPGNRFLACFVDLGLLFLLPGIVGYVGVVVADLVSKGSTWMFPGGPDDTNPRDPLFDFFALGGIYLGLIMLCAIGLIAYQAYLTSTTGQSLGKRWIGLKIVRSDGAPAGFVRGWLLRRFLHTIVVAVPIAGPLYWLTDALWCLGPKGMCLHDHLSGTMVIAVPPVLKVRQRR